MRLLFVDDEPRVLDALRRVLRARRHEWDMTFLTDGAEALRLLADEPVDVVVSDMRMPGMDGAELLTHVRDQHPSVVRLVLSGHSEQEKTVQVVKVAHQFLSKPCEAETLTDAIQRAAVLRCRLQEERVRVAVGRIDALPSAPSTWVELTRVLDDESGASPADVAGVVHGDLAMSAKLLQLVNSSFLGLARQIVRVEEAIVYLGINTVRSLALSCAVFQAFEPDRRLLAAVSERVTRHGLACAAAAKRAAAAPADREAAFTAALLHDAGQLVLASQLPDLLAADLEAAAELGRPLHEVQVERNGYSHVDVGGYLLALWGLPMPVVEAVVEHFADPGAPGPAAAVQLAHRQVAEEERAAGAAEPIAVSR